MRRWVWLVVPAVFAVYVLTMAPVVGLIDSGELAVGCRFLNVLHPTGYPLFTLLGRLAALLPLGAVVNRVALLSALFAAAGTGVLLWLLLRLKLSPSTSGAVAFLVGLSLPVWSVAVDAEVYSLTFLLGALLVMAAEGVEARRGLLLFAYLCGLVLVNHMSGLALVLGLGLCALLEHRAIVARRFVPLLLLVLLGLTPYLGLVLRARAEPLLAWGNPVNLERLWWHVTGRQYQVWMFKSTAAEVLANAGRGGLLLLRSLGYVLAPAVFVGFAALWSRRRGLAAGLGLSALLAFGYAVNYSIPDIEAYYLPALMALAVLCAAGLDRLGQRVGRWRHLIWVPALAMAAVNLPEASRRGDYVAHDEALNTLASADSAGIILTDWWDLYAPAFYLQHVEGQRPDLCIVDKELVRRSWYLTYLERQYPDLCARSRQWLNRYRPLLDDFEHNRLVSPVAIQRAYIELLRSFVAPGGERPAYVTYAADQNDDARELLAGLNLAPVGLLFEVRTDSILPEFDYGRFTVRIPPRRIELRTKANLDRYGWFCRRRTEELLARSRRDEALALDRWWVAQLGPVFLPGGAGKGK